MLLGGAILMGYFILLRNTDMRVSLIILMGVICKQFFALSLSRAEISLVLDKWMTPLMLSRNAKKRVVFYDEFVY